MRRSLRNQQSGPTSSTNMKVESTNQLRAEDDTYMSSVKTKKHTESVLRKPIEKLFKKKLLALLISLSLINS